MFVFLLWFKEAAKGVLRNFWWNTVAFSLSLICLFAFAVFYSAGDNAEYFSEQLNDKLEITVNVNENVTNYSEIKERLSSDERVSQVEFVSKEQAQTKMETEMGEDTQVLEIFDGKTIMPAQFIVKLHNAEEIETLAKDIQNRIYSDRVLYGKEYIDTLLDVSAKFKEYGLYASLLGALFVITIVMFVIRMNIEQRKEEIKIKGLIGSSMFTIRMPFILEAIALMGASSVAVYFLFSNLYQKLNVFILEQLPMVEILSLAEMQESLLIPLFGTAAILGIFGSVFATNKHLKRV